MNPVDRHKGLQSGASSRLWRHFSTLTIPRLKWLSVTDEFRRQNLALKMARRMTSSEVIKNLERLVEERRSTAFIRTDTGPEFMAEAVHKWIAARRFKPH